MYLLWNGALTLSLTARLIPNDFAFEIAESTNSVNPEITTWPGQLKLAGLTSPFCETDSHSFTASSWLAPIRAAIEPTPSGTASCMKTPLSLTSLTASENSITPEAQRAVYSPKL